MLSLFEMILILLCVKYRRIILWNRRNCKAIEKCRPTIGKVLNVHRKKMKAAKVSLRTSIKSYNITRRAFVISSSGTVVDPPHVTTKRLTHKKTNSHPSSFMSSLVSKFRLYSGDQHSTKMLGFAFLISSQAYPLQAWAVGGRANPMNAGKVDREQWGMQARSGYFMGYVPVTSECAI